MSTCQLVARRPLDADAIGVAGQRRRRSPRPPARTAVALREQVERACGDPGGVHQLPQDRVHPVGVELDPPEHQLAVLGRHRLPPGRESVPEPLHRGERRADVVRRGGDDRLEHRPPALATLALPLEQAHGRGGGEVQGLGPTRDRHPHGRVGEAPRSPWADPTPRCRTRTRRDRTGRARRDRPRRRRPSRGSACPASRSASIADAVSAPARPAGGTASPPRRARSSGCTRRPRTRRTRRRRRRRRRRIAAPSRRSPDRGPHAAAPPRPAHRAGRRTGRRGSRATPTNPCGVTVPARRAITSSLTCDPATPAGARAFDQGMRGLRVEQGRDPAAGHRERLAQCLGALDQERAFALAERPLVELERRGDLRVPDGGDHAPSAASGARPRARPWRPRRAGRTPPDRARPCRRASCGRPRSRPCSGRA